MIKIKSAHEVKLMREAGRLAAEARAFAGSLILPGVTTGEINNSVLKFIKQLGGTPTFLGYGGYPAALCCSINEEVIHGLPTKRKIQEGDIVKIDVGVTYGGYVGDCAETFMVGKVPESVVRLVETTRQSFYEGIKFARSGQRISDISHAIQKYNEERGFSVVRDFVGHGIGSVMHEEPEVPNYGPPNRGPRLVAGMTLAIEPMVNEGVYGVRTMEDGWTVKTLDGKMSAHYENTILITDAEPIILTIAGGQNGQ